MMVKIRIHVTSFNVIINILIGTSLGETFCWKLCCRCS